jgi:predicted neutral ceramidase superfamily lipid hydrolase
VLRSNGSEPGTKRQQITEMVGEEAANLAYRAVVWLRVAALMAFPTMPVLAVLASTLRNHYLLIGVAVALVLGISFLVVGGIINRRASNAASAFLSSQYGRQIRVKSGGTRLWGWQQEMKRAMGP